MPSDDCLKKLYIEPTARCNLRCKMCFRNSWKNEIIGDMRPETFRKAMTTMPDSVETVFFGGMGEPLAHPDIVEMVRTASSLGKRVELLSNGTLLDARRTAELLDAGLDMLWLSIDALDDGRYAQIRRNSQLALVKEHIVEFNRQRARLDRPVRLGVAFVVMKSNAHELALLPYFSTYYKVNEVNISNVIPTDEHTASEVLYNNVVDWGLGDPAPMASSPRIHLPLLDWQDPAAQEAASTFPASASAGRPGTAASSTRAWPSSSSTAMSAPACPCCAMPPFTGARSSARPAATFSAIWRNRDWTRSGTPRTMPTFAAGCAISSSRPATGAACARTGNRALPTASATMPPPVAAASGPRASSAARRPASCDGSGKGASRSPGPGPRLALLRARL